jgi:membrane protease YdiL (CAAX protease family)
VTCRWPRIPVVAESSDRALRRRRTVVAYTAATGVGLLGASLSTEPDSPQFYALTLGAASAWAVGGLSSGTIHRGAVSVDAKARAPVGVPILVGAGAFAAFYGVALVARHIPVLDEALTSVLQYAHQGSDGLVLLTTLANGAAEEVFFRGALYDAAGTDHPVALSTAGYLLATTATRNPALVLASAAMGTVFAWQRRATGGIQAPLITHLTWSTLMLKYLPPLFTRRGQPDDDAVAPARRPSYARPRTGRGRSRTRH